MIQFIIWVQTQENFKYIKPSHCIKSRLICSSAPNDIALTSGLWILSNNDVDICLHADKHVVWDNCV